MSLVHFLPCGAENHIQEFFERVSNGFEFYRKRFDLFGITPADAPLVILDKLPVLTPDDYIRLEREVFSNVCHQRFLTDLTTGTTGQRKTRFVTSRDDEAEALLCERFFRQAGISSDDSILALDIDGADIYLFYGQVLQELGVRHFLFGSVPSDFSESVKPLLHTDPSTLITVPTLLSRLLPLVTDGLARGRLRHLKRVIYLGESMPVWLRVHLEKILGLEVFSFYGSTEIGSVGGECKAHNGIHIYHDAVIPTLLNPTVGPYQSGEVVWTTLHFSDHPLVKYATRDYVTVSSDVCECGLVGPRLYNVRRLQDEFVLYGNKFSYEAFANALSGISLHSDFLQIEVDEDRGQIHVTFRLPKHLEKKQVAVCAALRGTNELAYFEELKFLTYEVKFDGVPMDNGRKGRRVVDRRGQ